MRLLVSLAIIIGCYACSDSQLKQGDTEKTGDTTNGNPNEANANVNLSKVEADLLPAEPGGIFKSFNDAGRGKGDVGETKKLSFIANEKPKDKTITYGSQTDQKTITMRSSYESKSQRKTTNSLETITEQFTQRGREATTYRPRQTRKRGREYKGLLDLLIVVDNSDSMETRNDHLKKNLDKLIPNIRNTDWKILMMNSESRNEEGRRECRRIITNKADFSRELAGIIGETGAWRENIPWQIRKGLANCRGGYRDGNRVGFRKNTRNSWMRDGSTLAVLVFTDEDFQCSRCRDNRCDARPLVCSTSAIDALPELKCNSFHCGYDGLGREFSAYRTNGRKLAFYAVFRENNKTCANGPTNVFNKSCKRVSCSTSGTTNPCYDDGNHPNRSRRLIYSHNINSALSDLQGIYVKKDNIDNNFVRILHTIASDIEGRLKNRFQIRDKEIESVTVAGRNRSDYRRDGDYLIFTGTAPNSNDWIVVTYREITNTNARDYDRNFTLRHTPNPNTVRVEVNRNNLPESGNWRVSGNTIELLGNVKNITPSDANIKITYKRRPQDVAKQGRFLLSNDGYILPNSVQVNKGCRGSYTTSGFSFSDRRVTFDSGNEPDHGQQVCFKYQAVIENNYIYNLNVVQGSEGFSCHRQNGTAVTCQHYNNKIYFTNDSQFPPDVGGIQVVVSYTKPLENAFIEALDKNYIKESVTLSSGGTTCDYNQLVFSNNELNLAQADNQSNSSCQFLKQPDLNQQIILSYRIHNQIFDINDPKLDEWRAIYEIEVWEVMIGDQPTTDFTIDKTNHKLSFADDLGENKEIVVTVSFMN